MGPGGPRPPLAEILGSLEEQKFVSNSEENYKRKTSTLVLDLLRLTSNSKFLCRSSYNMQKGSHLVCGMFLC